jgi:hypothetical protein
MLSVQSFLREGRIVGLCWAQFKPKGPKRNATAEEAFFGAPLCTFAVALLLTLRSDSDEGSGIDLFKKLRLEFRGVSPMKWQSTASI